MLSVASLTPEAQPSKFTMAGPWVGIAAPGENIVSVSNRDDGGLANALPNDKQQLVPLNGTSYAAGYVAGVAALVRSKYPQLTAAQVVQRITATAHNAARAPSNLVGAGTVDPVAALTWELPASGDSHAPAVKQLAAPSEPAPMIPHRESSPSPAPRYSRWSSWSSLRLPRTDERSPPREPAPILPLAGNRTGDAAVAGRRARRDGVSVAIDA